MSSPRVVSMCPGLINRIEECWEPHHFRDVIKSSKNAFKPLDHLAVVIVRIDLVMSYKPLNEAKEALLEIREELVEFMSRNPQLTKTPTHFKRHQKHLRILSGEKSFEEEKNGQIEKPMGQFLTENKEIIEKNLTLQVYEETKRNKNETARRLGISVGRLVQRLIRYEAYP